MRPPRGTMMTPQRVRPDAVPAAHAAHLHLIPMTRALTLQRLALQRAGAQAQQAAQMGQWLLRSPFDLQAAFDLFEMAAAIGQQWQGLQAQWAADAAELGEEMAQLRRADTVSKYADQEVNLMQQTLALLASHGAATLQLMENAQNNFGWWLAQRTDPAPA